MKEVIQIDSRNADAFMAELAKKLGTPIETTVRGEAREILQKTMDRARVRSAKTTRNKVHRTYNTFSMNGVGKGAHSPKISEGKKTSWYVRESEDGGLKFLIMNGARKWSPKIWGEWQGLLSARVPKRKARADEMIRRRGLPKRSWLMLAEAVGLKLRAAGYIVNATVNGKMMNEVARVLINKSPKVFSITFQNLSRVSARWKHQGALLSALRGRVKFFETNLQKGVFNSAKEAAAKYPGIIVK